MYRTAFVAEPRALSKSDNVEILQVSDPTRPRVRVILNPSAGSGSALRRVGEIDETLRRFDLPHEIVLTRQRGHAQELARAAAEDGVDVIAVVGGDGTLNEVAQAYLGPN